MSLLKLTNINKEYVLDKGTSFKALKNINLSFESSGLVCIKGKSGSGKSTLLNLIALFDKPTNGNIQFDNNDISKFKEKDINYYRNRYIGMLFQSYNLIDEETVLYNIMLPSLISGQSEERSKKDAIQLLQKINFPENYYDKKVSMLSGGEKQRVSLLRSLINSPPILLCDEPTGALDSKNSIAVMDILKKVGHRKLVILVSHNDKLIQKYADRIITIQDGEIIKDEIIKDEKNGKPIAENRIYKKSNFIKHFLNKNIKNHIKRNIFSIISLTVSLTAVLLSVGFSDHANQSLLQSCLKQFDLGVSTISKQSKTDIPGSSLSMSQISRFQDNEISEIKNDNTEFIFEDNYSYFIPQFLTIKADEIDFSDLSYSPIYSFKKPYVSDSFIIKGKLPKKDSLNEVIINDSAYKKIKESLNEEPLYKHFKVSNSVETAFNDEFGNQITDNITYYKDFEIVGVVNELSFLQTPKIYYSYVALKDFFDSYLLENITERLGYEYTVSDQIRLANGSDPITSYSHYCFLKDINNFNSLTSFKNKVAQNISFTNNDFSKYETLSQFVSVISLALTVFLIVAILGSSLIFGIINFSSYISSMKTNAILFSLGARREDISLCYIYESLTVGIISFLLSFIFGFVISKILNAIIFATTQFENLIVIPFKSFRNIPLSLPLIMLLGIIIISILTTYLPILLNKNIPLKKELETND